MRTVHAVAPNGWPDDFHFLAKRWEVHGLPPALVAYWSPGEKMAQQPVSIPLDAELTPYGCRHAFALRLAQKIGLHVREAAELMGHSPAVHLSTYGRRLDSPKLINNVIERLKTNSRE